MHSVIRCLFALSLVIVAGVAQAICVDNVVLVHGNTGSPSDFNNTRNTLLARGYSSSQIFRPSWGSSCAACNDHLGSEEAPVENSMIDAIASSCTGRIDVIGHSMGATLAARVIDRVGMKNYVDSFVGIAGAFRGLRSCGTYPFNIWTSTCGSWGLSVNSPFLNGISGHRFGSRMTSIKSYYDEIVCSTGICTVGGVHSSSISGENATVTYTWGHYGLLWYTSSKQADLIQ